MRESCIPSLHSIFLREIGREMSGASWSSWWNLVSGEASASVRAGFVQLDPPVDGSAGLVLFLGAGQLDDPPWTSIPLYGSL